MNYEISADDTIQDVSGESTLGELKEKIKTEFVSIYFHNGVEIEFGDEILLWQLFGPESINDQGVAQVDILEPQISAQSILKDDFFIKSEKRVQILETSGNILTLLPGEEKRVTVSGINRWVSLSK